MVGEKWWRVLGGKLTARGGEKGDSVTQGKIFSPIYNVFFFCARYIAGRFEYVCG